LAIPQFIVRKSAVNYTASADGSLIVLRPNNASEATMVLDNSVGEFTTVFAAEDEVDIYIDSVSAANHMMVGFIDNLTDDARPNGQKFLKLHIVDWGGYLAAKTVFEKNFLRTKKVANLFADAAAEIAGLSTNIIGLATVDDDIKRNFQGTYVKDGWFAAAENGGADFFVDETKTLQAFAHDTQDLEQSPSNKYRVRDVEPSLARDLQIDFMCRNLYNTRS